MYQYFPAISRLPPLALWLAHISTLVYANHKGSESVPPVSFKLEWQDNDVYGGFYTLNVSVGTPPQYQILALDPEYSDILLHASSDTLYKQACEAQTPVPTCQTFDNATSSTFIDYGSGTFMHVTTTPQLFGDYISDTLWLGPVSIKNQTMALVNLTAYPLSVFGTGPPSQQDGARTGTFPKYPSFLEKLVEQGVYDSASFSIWLDPSLGPGDNPNTFPPGEFIIGGIDTALFTESFTTLPVVADNSSTIPAVPERWNLLLYSMHLGNSRQNLVSGSPGDSCVIAVDATGLFLPNDTYNNLVGAFPNAVFNATTTLYDVPCSDRFNSNFDLSLAFTDPRDGGAAGSREISFTIPAAETVWPTDRLVNGGDPNACAVAAYSIISLVTGETFGEPCTMGVSVMKSGYWVYDLTNAEISFAPAAQKGERQGKLERLPSGGVKELFA